MAQGSVCQVFHPGTSNGSIVQFQQLPVDVKSCNVALGRCQRRTTKNCRSFLLAARQGPLLSQRGLRQSVTQLFPSCILMDPLLNGSFQLILDVFGRLPNGHINFEKFWQLAKQVTEFMTWKQVTCPFDKHPKVIHYLQTGTILSENGNEF